MSAARNVRTDRVELTFDRRTPNGLFVNLDKLIESRAIVQANSGGGKSHALRYLLEQTHGKVQHLVIDPEGEFSTLREHFPYVLVAGRDGDVLATPKTARLVCRRLMELGASAVLDVYDLKLPERRQFIRLFLDELMSLPRTLWRRLLVVLDEAHMYAPERGHGEAESTDAVVSLASQGRKRGYCLVAATQRLSKLHKDVAAELNNKLIGRTGLDLDLKRAGDELGFDKEQRAQLKHLSPGQWFGYGPAIANEVTLVWTGDVVTTHPRAGKLGSAPPPAPAAIAKMLEQLRDLPQQAAEEARTVEDLRKRVRELEAAAKAKPSTAPPKVIEKSVLKAEHLKKIEASLARVEASGKALLDVVAVGLRQMAAAAQANLPAAAATPGIVTSKTELYPGLPMVRVVGPIPSREFAPPRTEPPRDSETPAIKRGAREILKALASRAPNPLSRAQVATLAGLSPTSGTFTSYLSTLRTAGFVAELGVGLTLTTSGDAFLGGDRPGVAQTTEELFALWSRRLKRGARDMLAALINKFPEAVTREQLGAAVGLEHTSGTFTSYLSILRSNGLIEEVPRRDGMPGREVCASETLFPGATP